MRTHIIISNHIIETIDDLVGPRARSKFFEQAVEEKLSRIRLLKAAKEVAGSLKDVATPGWETPEAAAAWVHNSRRADMKRLKTNR